MQEGDEVLLPWWPSPVVTRISSNPERWKTNKLSSTARVIDRSLTRWYSTAMSCKVSWTTKQKHTINTKEKTYIISDIYFTGQTFTSLSVGWLTAKFGNHASKNATFRLDCICQILWLRSITPTGLHMNVNWENVSGWRYLQSAPFFRECRWRKMCRAPGWWQTVFYRVMKKIAGNTFFSCIIFSYLPNGMPSFLHNS